MNMDYRKFYKELYYKELERKELYHQKLNYLIPLTIGLSGFVVVFFEISNGMGLNIHNFLVGMFLAFAMLFMLLKNGLPRIRFGITTAVIIYIAYYLIKSYTLLNIDVAASNFLWITVVCFIVTILIIIYLLVRLIYNYSYSYLPLPTILRAKRRKLNSDYKFESYLIRRYSQGAEINTINNDLKSAYLHKVHTAMIFSFIVILVSLIPYFAIYGGTDIVIPKNPAEVEALPTQKQIPEIPS